MIFAVYAGENDASIKDNLGMPDYSYYFVLKSYLPVLEQLGTVFLVGSLEKEGPILEQLSADCKRRAEPFLFLSFTPPHTTWLNETIPSLTVFAWEYSTIPQEEWGGDPRNDWRLVLGLHGLAITHSRFAVTAVKEAMGDSYPIVSVPAPVWDSYQKRYDPDSSGIQQGGVDVRFEGALLQSGSIDFSQIDDHNKGEAIAQLVDEYGVKAEQSLKLEGVVYTAVINPVDGRKNWLDVLWAFCWAFRDNEDVTLLIKVTYYDVKLPWERYLLEFYKLQPFKCKVVLLHGYLEDEAYDELLRATSFVVNAAHGEGQCLPLMEFMAAGKPAIAPDHSAMADYITAENAFVVESNPEWWHWPHDSQFNLRTLRRRISWESLYRAYLESYEQVLNRPDDYRAMAAAANRSLRNHSSRAVAQQRLAEFFTSTLDLTQGPAMLRHLKRLFRAPGWRDRLLRKYSQELRLHSPERGGVEVVD